eukprot:5622901-Pyramimonas_sp.AAC.1
MPKNTIQGNERRIASCGFRLSIACAGCTALYATALSASDKQVDTNSPRESAYPLATPAATA